MVRARKKESLFRGMLSLEEIKEWANRIEDQSTSKLIKFSHDPARPAHRAVERPAWRMSRELPFKAGLPVDHERLAHPFEDLI